MTTNLQDAAASLTWLHDWTSRLARAETDLGLTPGSLTLSAPTVTGPTGTNISGVQATVDGTGVLFHLEVTGLTPPQDITLTTSATLSNGDEDVCDLVIGIR